MPKPLKAPSLARSVPKPLKVPSLARSVPKPLSIFALATVRPSLVATSHPRPSLARSVPKPLSIFAVGTSAGPCCEVISLNIRCSHFGPALSLPAVLVKKSESEVRVIFWSLNFLKLEYN